MKMSTRNRRARGLRRVSGHKQRTLVPVKSLSFFPYFLPLSENTLPHKTQGQKSRAEINSVACIAWIKSLKYILSNLAEQQRPWEQPLFAEVWVWRSTSVMAACILSAVQNSVRSGYAEGRPNRWLLVPLIPYRVKQASLENSHSNMSILRQALEGRAVQPSEPPHLTLPHH